jgi:hypothetical protein
MKTLEQVISGYKSETIDGRDLSRLADFLTVEQALIAGVTFKDEYVATHRPKKFTKENILEQLKQDVDFGFGKALNKRGISAGCMHSVVSMWNWILEDGLEGFDDYAQYGLPLFKATAIKYGFDNPIGEDRGDEFKYSSGGDY